MDKNITLIAIGPVPPALLSWLAERLAKAVGQKVVIGEEVALPASGYNARRHQYHGDALLAMLRTLRYPETGQVVGLTEADCYAPGLNFVFGQAQVSGREAFVALPRLQQSFYGLPDEPVLFRERVLKEVIHELGHSWGLAHCPNVYCVMHFSNTLRDTDVKEATFCPRCRDRLDWEQKQDQRQDCSGFKGNRGNAIWDWTGTEDGLGDEFC